MGVESTIVEKNKDGTYQVKGGNVNDGDNGIYLQGKDGAKGDLVGYSATPSSFFESETNTWQGKINPNDQSGRDFLNEKIIRDNPGTYMYAKNAGNGKKYDFKSTNGTSGIKYEKTSDFYRGMPILGTKNGKQIYASARDIGNIGAGLVAGRAGLNWTSARIGFDGYQSSTAGKINIEGISTQYAEKLGYRIGNQMYQQETLSRLPGNGELRNIKISDDVINKGDL